MRKICAEERAAVFDALNKKTGLISDSEKITSKDILSALKMNEVGDAELFVKYYRSCLLYDHTLENWFLFNGNYWEKDLVDRVLHTVQSVTSCYMYEMGEQAKKRIEAVANGRNEDASNHEKIENDLVRRVKNLQTLSRSKKVLEFARAGEYPRTGLGFDGKAWDTDPWLLGCLNGVINLNTGQMRQGRQEDFIKCICPTQWKGIDEPCPNFEAFLWDVFEDEDLISFLQRLLGYCITGLTTESKFIIFEGRGRNGKSTLLDTLYYVLGPMAGPIDVEMILAQVNSSKNSSAPTPDLMNLRGKRLVWASESDEGRRLSIGKVKSLTSPDAISARPPHGKEQVEITPTHKIILATNHLPKVPASSDDFALWKRLLLIRFPFSFVEDPKEEKERKIEKDISSTLKAEASGILAWLVRGCLQWVIYGIDELPMSIKNALMEYEADEDILGHFINERCMLHDSFSARFSDLYEAYCNWCKDAGHHTLSQNKFGRALTRRFKKNEKPYVSYKGIRLINSSYLS